MEQIKDKLNRELEDLRAQLALYKSEDPLADPDQGSSRTFDDVITVSEGHDRVVATRLGLKQRAAEVEAALKKIEAGTYGVCERCNQKINEERLAALTTATLCFKCESEDH
jgi:DnaK suppressor protein